MKPLVELIREALEGRLEVGKVTPITQGESGRDGLLVETTDDPPRTYSVLVRELTRPSL